MFANRTFLGKYYIGTRDIGFWPITTAMATVPVSIGPITEIRSTIGRRNELSYGGRLELGNMTGLRSTFKFLRLSQQLHNPLLHFKGRPALSG